MNKTHALVVEAKSICGRIVIKQHNVMYVMSMGISEKNAQTFQMYVGNAEREIIGLINVIIRFQIINNYSYQALK